MSFRFVPVHSVPFLCFVTPVTVAYKNTVVRIKGGQSEEIVGLNFGETLVKDEVTSPDGSNEQTCTMLISRSKIPRAINFQKKSTSQNLPVLYL